LALVVERYLLMHAERRLTMSVSSKLSRLIKPGAKAGGGGSAITAQVVRAEWLNPTMVRVVLGGPDFANFTANEYTDAYVKVVFPRPGVVYPVPLDMKVIRDSMPSSDWPQQRTYTVRAWNPQALELTIDFVVHGDDGLAGPWAAAAKPGDSVTILGPGGGYAPDPAADWHLLIGDESAVPAISTALERLGPNAVGHAVIEVDTPEQEQQLTGPVGVQLTWVNRGSRALGEGLVESVAALTFPSGTVHAFVHGEAGLVRELRRLLKVERGIPQSQLSISGYWRHGATDEGWRAVKRDWNRSIEESESQAGV
jgi:NADPH-dependent ferric siderophore reductase